MLESPEHMSFVEKTRVLLSTLLRWFVLASTLLILLTLYRLLFFHYFKSGGEWYFYKNDTLRAFALGFRFDLSALTYLGLPSFLILFAWTLIPTPQKLATFFSQVTATLFTFFMAFGILILGIDFGYYTYFQDHINVLIFGFFNDDTISLIKTLYRNYPAVQILAIWFIFIYFFHRLVSLWIFSFSTDPEVPFQRFVQKKRIATIFVVFCFLCLGIVARGTFHMYPLGVFHTAIGKNSFINNLSLNGIHALGHAIEVWSLEKNQKNPNLHFFGYQNNPTQAFSDYYQKSIEEIPNNPFAMLKKISKENSWGRPPHIVFVLNESMGSDWLNDKRFPPELVKNLYGSLYEEKNQAFWNLNTMPSSGATIGSLGGLLINWPHRMRGSFLTEGDYFQTAFPTAPARILKQNGYQTHFIYGGQLGWRGVNRFAPLQGFDELHGEPEISSFIKKKKSLETHDWGMFDHDVYDYAQNLLNHAQSPQFIFILTTTNHPPYQLPEKADNSEVPELRQLLSQSKLKFANEPHLIEARLKCFRYSNQSLGEFIRGIRNSALKDQTLIAATGDHAFYLVPYLDSQILQKWAVPTFIYDPKKRLPLKENNLVLSHMNLFPTIFDLSLNKAQYSSIGDSLLSDKNFFAIHSSSIILDTNLAVEIKSKNQGVPFMINKDSMEYDRVTIPAAGHSILLQKYSGLMGIADIYFEAAKNKSKELSE